MESGGMGNLIFIATIFAVFYFFLIRPQAKRQKQQSQFVDALQKGDEVVTSSGIIGKISKLDESIVQIQIDAKTFITFTRGSVNKEMTEAYLKSKGTVTE